jgi:hypothetical protein
MICRRTGNSLVMEGSESQQGLVAPAVLHASLDFDTDAGAERNDPYQAMILLKFPRALQHLLTFPCAIAVIMQYQCVYMLLAICTIT